MTFNRYISRNVSRRVTANRQRVAQIAAEDSRIPSLTSSPEAMLVRERTATALQQLWKSLIPEGAPDPTQFFEWLDRFGAGIVEHAIKRTSQKARQRRFASDPMTSADAARYAAATARNMAETQ